MLSGPHSDSITVPVTLWFQFLYVVLWLSCISSVRLSSVLSPLNIALRNPKLLSHSLDEVSGVGTLFKTPRFFTHRLTRPLETACVPLLDLVVALAKFLLVLISSLEDTSARAHLLSRQPSLRAFP